MLSVKESPDYANLPDTYWMSFWKNINLSHNYNTLLSNFNLVKHSYLPTVVEYVEYDFMNWQALESLEDSIWESSYSAFNHDDYMNIRKNSAESQLYNKTQIKYNHLNRYDKEKEYKLKKTYSVRSFSLSYLFKWLYFICVWLWHCK
jgi:hypothetical protein